MCGGNAKEAYLEILCFKQFYKHFVFGEDEEGNGDKRMEKYFEVSAVVDVGCGDTLYQERILIIKEIQMEFQEMSVRFLSQI